MRERPGGDSVFVTAMDQANAPMVTAQQQADLDCYGFGLTLQASLKGARSNGVPEKIVRVYQDRLRKSDGARDWKTLAQSASTMRYGWFMGHMQSCQAGAAETTKTSHSAPETPWASLRFADGDLVEFRAEIQDGPNGYRAIIDCVRHCPVQIRYSQDVGETPLGLFKPWDGDDLVYSTWAGGSAYWVRVWAVTSHGISQVLEVASRARPDFLATKDGVSVVRTYEADSGLQPLRPVTWRYQSGRFSRTEGDAP